MVISASRKTDIPAFYGDWLLNRLEEGYCVMRNSYSRRPKRVSLAREDVDAFVFWTKNPKPFLPALSEIARRRFPFYLHVTVTGYGQPMERSVASWESVVDCCRRLVSDFGPRTVAWRYDPIVITEAMTPAWHAENFARLADVFAGISDEVATSFVEPYRKVRSNLDRLSAKTGVRWRDPALDEKRDLVRRLSGLGAERGMLLRVCSQPEVAGGLPEGRCIDPVRLRDVGASSFSSRSAPTRTGCNCIQSIDIGEYDTCPQGCAYCYANRDRETAVRNLKEHSDTSESILCLGPSDPVTVNGQMHLFDRGSEPQTRGFTA
ncbi:MAG: DUF1848 family protein [Fimbriimonadaceae bacterium]|nr:hypothetical protein [Fimbriimonadaceae bacterium]MCL4283701.1 DUF1848 family protein [Fimbriimonadaceae bacterium]QOJ11441.1 MAG: DUF1848 domain-containing protein [Chthonomonadaceae bacterium]